jgi:glycosyltransferase involved in cell wall biosynthesis
MEERPLTTELPQSSELRERDQRKVIAGVPSYNVESFVGEVVRRAREYVDQVVVIDDGSSDRTAEVAREAGAVVRSHEVNLGYGGAIKSCFEAAREMDADVLVILDGDGQHDSDEVPQIVAPVLNDEADVVIGSRFLDRNSDIPFYRRFGIHVITWLFNVGSKTKITDSQSGFRAYSKRSIQAMSLQQKGMPVSVEILVRARRKGLVFREVPISCRYHAESSTMNPVKQGLTVAMKLVRMRLSRDGKNG